MPGQPELKYICVGSVAFREAAKSFPNKSQERNNFDVPIQHLPKTREHLHGSQVMHSRFRPIAGELNASLEETCLHDM
jgi:hypothetical protein